MDRPIWLHYHNPKTGGTTFNMFLQQQLGEDALMKLDWTQFESQPDVDRAVHTRHRKLTALVGHLVRDYHADLVDGRPVRELVIVREPSAWLSSQYNFDRTLDRTQEPFDEYVDARRDWIPYAQSAYVFNAALSDLAATSWAPENFGAIITRLDRFAAVGVTEQVDPFAVAVLGHMGVTAPTPPVRHNTTPPLSSGPPPATPALARDLLGPRVLDDELYEYARERCDAFLHAADGRRHALVGAGAMGAEAQEIS